MDINKYKVVLTDTATEELEDIYKYISNNLKEVSIANRLMEKIEQSLLILEENPYAYTQVHIKPHNDVYRKLTIENYIVLYDVKEKAKQAVVYRIVYKGMDYLKEMEG